MSTQTTENDVAGDGNGELITLDQYVQAHGIDGRLGDDSYIADGKAARTAVESSREILSRYTPAKRTLDDIVLEGCKVCLDLRAACIRGDNGAADYYGRSDVYGELWRTYTGSGKAAEAYRSAVTSRLSLEQLVQKRIARDQVAAGNVQVPKTLKDGSVAKKDGKDVMRKLTLDELDTAIADKKEASPAVTAAVDKVLSTQVYTGKGESAGKRVQGAELAITQFGNRVKAPKTPPTDKDKPDSAATGGNADSGTPEAAMSVLLGSTKETLLSQATHLYQYGSKVINLVLSQDPSADRTEALEQLAALQLALTLLNKRESQEKVDGKIVAMAKVRAALYQDGK